MTTQPSFTPKFEPAVDFATAFASVENASQEPGTGDGRSDENMQKSLALAQADAAKQVGGLFRALRK